MEEELAEEGQGVEVLLLDVVRGEVVYREAEGEAVLEEAVA